MEIAKTAGRNTLLDSAVSKLKETFARTGALEFRARYLIEQLALTMQASLLLESAPAAIAEAFIHSRLCGGQAIYGCLPENTDVDAILARVLPDNP
jgi:putative acyl-CoA dehydrogenase